MRQFTLTVSDAEMQTVIDALQELPFKRVNSLINSLHAQAMSQLQPAPPPDASAATDPLPALPEVAQ
ncbi:hypothetical protein [Curvibacter gracilis]|uniref:hypothetical protein n=1 Tax=Curvibacter gracilis TaxID=230310 RepID=UPI00048A135F|nr:hypothetical protein [Curvibacter gracilis]